MARKTAIPAEQLDRLKDLYGQERKALVALASAEESVDRSEQDVAVAQEALKNAQAGVDSAYQALVGLVGSGVAAALTGREHTARRSPRSTVAEATGQPQRQRRVPADRAVTRHGLPAAVPGQVTG